MTNSAFNFSKSLIIGFFDQSLESNINWSAINQKIEQEYLSHNFQLQLVCFLCICLSSTLQYTLYDVLRFTLFKTLCNFVCSCLTETMIFRNVPFTVEYDFVTSSTYPKGPLRVYLLPVFVSYFSSHRY